MPTLKDDVDRKRVVDIACGSYHSVALTESGEVNKVAMILRYYELNS